MLKYFIDLAFTSWQMCMVLCVCMLWPYGCPKRPEKGVEFPRAGVKGSCELPIMSAGSPAHPLEEHQTLLTTDATTSPAHSLCEASAILYY